MLLRAVVKHRMAHLAQLSIRRCRYFGIRKIRPQVLTYASVTNASLVVAYCKRQAQQGETVPAEVAATARTTLLGTLLVIWKRYFASSEPTGEKATHRPL